MGFIIENPPIRKAVKESLEKKLKIKVPLGSKIIPRPIAEKLWDPPEYIEVDHQKVPFELAKKIVADTDWARNLAKGWVEKVLGLKPGDPGYEEAVRKVALKVAEGVLT